MTEATPSHSFNSNSIYCLMTPRLKVAFGETRKIINENAQEILEKAPKMTMEDLERFCEETPLFVVDVDQETNEASDFTAIKTDEIGQDVSGLLQSKKGIVVFD